MPCAALHSRKCACNQARPHLAGADGRPGRRQEGPVAHCASIQLFIYRYLRKILQASRAGQRHSSFSHAAPAVHQNEALNQRMTASSRLLMIMTGACRGQETIGKSLSHHHQQGALILSHSSHPRQDVQLQGSTPRSRAVPTSRRKSQRHSVVCGFHTHFGALAASKPDGCIAQH